MNLFRLKKILVDYVCFETWNWIKSIYRKYSVTAREMDRLSKYVEPHEPDDVEHHFTKVEVDYKTMLLPNTYMTTFRFSVLPGRDVPSYSEPFVPASAPIETRRPVFFDSNASNERNIKA